MPRKTIEFQNTEGDQLSAALELPLDQKPHNFVLFAHCFTCNKNFKAVRYISKALAAQGFAVLSFDFTGLGASDGEFADTNFSSSVEDLIAAAGFLDKNYEAPTLIIGHSLGGAAALLAASRLTSVKAAVTIGSPADPNHVRHLISSGLSEIKQQGVATVSIGGRPFTVKQHFVDDLQNKNLAEIVRQTPKSFLFLHSPQDTTVGIENAAELYGAAKHPKSFVSLDGADHLLSDPKDSLYAGDVIASWAKRYVEIDAEPEISTNRQVVAYVGPDEKFTTQIVSDKHRMIADEPVSFGGNDFGPSPYQYVSSGLAACTVMTLRMYADRKKWDLRQVFCHVKHDKSYVEDCQNCEDVTGKIDVFHRELELIGDLDQEQRQRLMEIADKCPVHRTLEAKAHITTTLRGE